MRHAAFAAGEMKGQMRPHQRPAQAGAVGDRGIDVGDRDHAFGDEMNRLAPQRGLQPVGDVARHFLLDVDRLLAEPRDRTPSPSRSRRRRSWRRPTTSTSGMRCGGLNGWPITQRSGCLHFVVTRLISSPDELEAMTTSGGNAASSTANSASLRILALRPAFLHEVRALAASAGVVKNEKRARSAPAPRCPASPASARRWR